MGNTSRNYVNSSLHNDQASLVPVMSLYIINIFLAVALNSLMLVVIPRQRELQDAMRIMYQMLTFLNLFLGIGWSTWSIIWFFFNNSRTCTVTSNVFPFLFRVTIVFALAYLCGIHFVLYIILSKPLHHHRIVTLTKIKLSVIVVLVVTLVTHVLYLPIPGRSFVDVVIKRCLDQEEEEGSLWFKIDMAFNITPPVSAFVFILIIQILIVRIARKQTRAVAAVDITVDRHRNRAELDIEPTSWNCCHDVLTKQIFQYYKQNKGLFTALLYTGSFIIIWVPYLLHLYSSNVSPLSCDLVACSRTWITSMVYMITNKEAKRICRQLFRSHLHDNL